MPGPIVLRCDGGGAYGVGHVMRQLALADELRSRDLAPRFIGRLTGADWLAGMLAGRDLAFEPAAADFTAQVRALGASAVVLDGYHLPGDYGVSLRTAGVPVAAMVDYAFGAGQAADLYVDQNLGADPEQSLPPAARPPDSQVLAGIDYTLFRDEVLALRRGGPRPAAVPPRVLAVFGGTDPYAAAPVVVPAVLAGGEPMVLTVVASSPQIAQQLNALPLSAGQELHVVPPTPQLVALAAEADLVVSASGSSVWEFLCLGVPTALVCVVDNQVDGYRRATGLGVAAGLGHLDDFDHAAATRTVGGLLGSASGLAGLTRAGQALVDGKGRARVADALVSLM